MLSGIFTVQCRATKLQIVFQNADTGNLAYWIMNGLSLDYFELPKPNNPASDWKLVGAK